jgi:hypothetical protein
MTSDVVGEAADTAAQQRQYSSELSDPLLPLPREAGVLAEPAKTHTIAHNRDKMNFEAMRRGSSTFATSAAPLSQTLLYSDQVSPSFDHATVVGFCLPHNPGAAALAVWEPNARSGSSLPLNYRSAAAFAVPKHQLRKATPFSLRRSLSTNSCSSGGFDGGGGERGRGLNAGRSSTANPRLARGGAKASASDVAAPSEGAPGWWKVDVGGCTRKGFMAGGGKLENQDRCGEARSALQEAWGGLI